MTVDPQRVQAVFLAAVEATDPAERQSILIRECEADADLRRRVEVLLLAHDNPESFLERPVVDPLRSSQISNAARGQPKSTSFQVADAAPGTIVAGRFRLLEAIGEGGMGTVWMAEQREPVKRLVALKLIKPGMASKTVLARFEAERQALALMDHPNIAKVLDGGTTEDGRPYFVMELVKGIPLTQYCDERRLSISERLDLFVQICQAVQHAHQKGVIHRDIKPTNILVTEHDGRPVPKVIDFGLAKALQGTHALTEQTLYTAFGAMVGTPLYMAPEQVGINALDVDTRSDVYALGVILYELLTGSTPLEKQRFKEAAWDEICRLIREEEPPRPSVRLSSSDAAPSIAACRHTEPEKLGRQLRGDLDWIVLKSLEKDRNRRYETANGLAMDIQRYLASEPIMARPPTSLYRFQKMVRRNKLIVAAAGAVLAALVVGLGLSTWLFIQERNARQRAVAAEAAQTRLREEAETSRANESTLRHQAEADEKTARTEAAKSAQVATFMEDMLNGVGPRVALGRDTKLLHEILDQTAKRLSALKEQPAVEADLRMTLGRVYDDLGDYASAETMFRAALLLQKQLLGDQNADVAQSLNGLANVLQQQGQLAAAEALYREALAMQQKVLGNEHRYVATSLNNLASVLNYQGKLAEAEALHRETLATRKKLLGNEHPDVAGSLHNLACVLRAQGRLAEAEAMHREALAMKKKLLGGSHPDVATSLSSLATVLDEQGKPVEAEALYREALEMQKQLLGNEHPDVATTLNNLANLLQRQGKLTDADSLQHEVLAMQKRLLGYEHPAVATSLNNLACVLIYQGKLAEAEALCSEALKMRKKLLGNEHPDVAQSLNNLASVRQQQGKLAEAETLFREALAMQQKLLGNEHPEVAASLNNLASVLDQQGKPIEAEALLRESLTMHRAQFGNEHPEVATSLNNLATVLGEQGKPAEAEAMHREALAIQRKQLGNEHPAVAISLSNLASVLAQQGKLAEAEALSREALAMQRKQLGNEHPAVASSLHNLALVLRRQGKLAEAETLFREALAMQQKLLGNEHSDVAASFSDLASVLDQQGKPVEAEALYREALAMRIKLLGNEHPDVASALQNLAFVLRRQGKLAEAEASYRDALAIRQKLLGNNHPDVATSLNNLASVLDQQGKPVEAEAMYREVLATQKKRLGNEHPEVATSLNNLAIVLGQQGKSVEAEALYREALAMRRKFLANDHPAVATSLDNLASMLAQQGKLTEAEALFREELAMLRKRLGNEHPSVARSLIVLADVLEQQSKLAEAEALFREALAMHKKLFGNKHPALEIPLNNLAFVLRREGKLAEAEQLFNELLTPTVEGHAPSAVLLEIRANFFGRSGRWKEAAADLTKVVELDPAAQFAWLQLAPLLVEMGNVTDYEKLRHSMLARFGDTGNPLVALRTTQTCFLLPASGAVLESTSKQTDKFTGRGNLWQECIRGLAEYREGHFDSAVEWAKKAVARPGVANREAQAYLVMAMAHQQLHQSDAARAALAKACEIVEAKLPKLDSDDQTVDWHDWLMTQILLREAKQLIEGNRIEANATGQS